MRQRWLQAGAAAILVAVSFAAGIHLSRDLQTAAPPPLQPSSAAIDKLLSADFTDVAGRKAGLAHLRGKPLIVNFWATWCPPCLKEMPVFSRLQERHQNIQFVGIAADTQSNVQTYVASHKLSYPVLIAADGAIPLMTGLGNGRNALPFTLSIDTKGQARHVRLGGLSEAETERIIAELSGS